MDIDALIKDNPEFAKLAKLMAGFDEYMEGRKTKEASGPQRDLEKKLIKRFEAVMQQEADLWDDIATTAEILNASNSAVSHLVVGVIYNTAMYNDYDTEGRGRLLEKVLGSITAEYNDMEEQNYRDEGKDFNAVTGLSMELSQRKIRESVDNDETEKETKPKKTSSKKANTKTNPGGASRRPKPG